MAVDFVDDLGLDEETGLPKRQRLLVDYYLTHFNQTKAFKQAGYGAESYEHARKDASNLFSLPHVQAVIVAKTRERAERLSISADRMLLEAAVVAYARVTDYWPNEKTGRVEVLPGVPVEALGAVKGAKITRQTRTILLSDGERGEETTWTLDIQMWDKLKALEMIGKHLGLFATELPPLEVLLNRLPPSVAAHLRKVLSGPPPHQRETERIPAGEGAPK